MSNPVIGEEKDNLGPPKPRENGNWECLKCGNVNYPQRMKCNRCQEPGGNWNCPKCGNLNYAHRERCNRCDCGRAGVGYGMMGMGGGMGTIEEASRSLVQAFAHEMNPVQSAINYLLSLSASNPMWFRSYGEQSSSYFSGGVGQKRFRAGPPKAGIDGNWACPNESCGNINFSHRDKCNRCQIDKPM